MDPSHVAPASFQRGGAPRSLRWPVGRLHVKRRALGSYDPGTERNVCLNSESHAFPGWAGARAAAAPGRGVARQFQHHGPWLWSAAALLVAPRLERQMAHQGSKDIMLRALARLRRSWRSPRSGRTVGGFMLAPRLATWPAALVRVRPSRPAWLPNPCLHPAGVNVLMEVSVVPLAGPMLRMSGRFANRPIARG